MMGDIAKTLVSAFVGFGAGLLGSALIERLKASVAALEAELVRLDGLQDRLAEALTLPAGTRSAECRAIASVRRRLGINLKSLILDSERSAQVSTLLSRLNKILQAAEDDRDITETLESELDEVARAIRQHVRTSSIKARAYWLLRGT